MSIESSKILDGDNPSGQTLADILGSPLPVGRFLHIAIGISTALAEIHKQHIIHKNINPATLFIDPGTLAVTIGGFTSASDLPVKVFSKGSRQYLSEQLAYLSPEITGRVSKVVDYRTDLYSLGIVFYEMVTGDLPFHAEDVIGWVHSHIARMPRQLINVAPSFPKILSTIVMKLLAKNAEDRYQTALGLTSDLKRCLAGWQIYGKIDPFVVGENDIPDRLLIPQKLYGREKHILTLLEIFNSVVIQGKARLVRITGYSGTGKSSLVSELFKPVIDVNGFFITGKFDQYKRDIPYLTIAEAFREPIQQILSGSEGEVALWKQRFQRSLGSNGQLVIDVISRLELIIGKQPPVPELTPEDAKKRFNMVLRKFVGAFTENGHPLVLFLDDVQWIDTASLELIKDIVSHDETRSLMLICAYRDNEVTSSHPLILWFDELLSGSRSIATITLTPLSSRELSRLLEDTLRTTPARLMSLTDLIYRKTGGNPFFSIQFLMTLYGEKLLYFDEQTRSWRWEINKIQAQCFTDNVVDLVVSKLLKLSIKAQEALRLGACIGNAFDFEGLMRISTTTVEELHSHLWEAIQEGLILLVDEVSYVFLHDRVQQAAYSLIRQTDRQEVHLRIGRLMLVQPSTVNYEEKVFEIVHQFNLGTALISDPNEKTNIAELNLLAGKKAKFSSAYDAALSYFTLAANLLNENFWEENYELIFEVCKERAIMEYLNSNYARSKKQIDKLLRKARTNLEKAELHNILIIQYTLTADYESAIQSGRKALKLLNIDVPEVNLKAELENLVVQNERILGGRSISSLIDDPLMVEPEWIVSLELLSNMVVPARYTDSTLFALVTVLNVNISLKFGVTPKSTVGYTAYGMVLNSVMGRYKEALEFGELSLKLSERLKAPTQKCQACFMIGHYLNHWVRHLEFADEIMSDGIQAGLASGEMQWTGYSFAYKLFQPFYRGVNLHVIIEEIPKLLLFTQKTENQWAIDTLLGFQLALSVLRPTDDMLGGTVEKQYFTICNEHRSFGAKGRYVVVQAQVHYLFGRFEDALEAVLVAQELLSFFSSSISVAALNFYHSLILSALYDNSTTEEKDEYLASIRLNQEQMYVWCENCDANFKHLYLLVEGELARLLNRPLESMQFYEQAIGAANKGGFTQDLGLANELAARYYQRCGLKSAAEMCQREARNAYIRWGATGKVQLLDRQYPQFTEMICSNTDFEPGYFAGNMDATTLVKASQAISGDIHLPNLLNTLMRIVIENAGADKGCLILVKENVVTIAARARLNGEDIVVQPEFSAMTPALVPISLINYAVRTRESIILSDASTSNLFSSDDYICREHPLSILCLPILRQTSLIGLLYLENNLVRGVFTEDRIGVLELLASQASISLENALLFADVQRENHERQKAEVALRQSEKRLTGIFDFLPDATFAIDGDGKVIAWNRAIEEMSGVSAEKMIGTTEYEYAIPFYGQRRPLMIDLVNVSDEELESNYITIERKGDLLLAEAKVEIKGRERVLSGIAAPLYDEGKVAGAIESMRDVTERKQNEEKIARWAAIIDQATEAIILTDLNWSIQYANPAFSHMTGYKPAEIIGQKTSIIKSDVHSGEFFRNIRDTMKKGESWSGRITNKKKDGSLYEVDATGSPYRDETGEIVSFIGIQRNITKEIKLERQLRQAQKMEAIGTLVGGVAHDFNNILTAIVGNAQLLTYKVPTGSPLLPQLNQVLQAGYRATDLVNQILSFSRQTDQEQRPVKIASLVEEVLKLMRSSLPSTIEIRKNISVTARGCTVLADETQVHQVLMNLCSNAAHAMRSSGGVVGLSLSTLNADIALVSRYHGLHVGHYVKLVVSDTGHGMDHAVMEQIFDPYFTTKPKGEGTGLGLAVVQGIVNNYGGIITVDSEPEKGTFFTIFLPLLKGETAQEAGEAKPIPCGKENVLFVDDEEMLVELGRDILESLGYSVTVTTSSHEALELFHNDPMVFDLLVTDMTMPELTGLELAEKVLTLMPGTPIVLFTGFCGKDLLERARIIGIRDVVLKPYDVRKMAETVRKNIEGGEDLEMGTTGSG